VIVDSHGINFEKVLGSPISSFTDNTGWDVDGDFATYATTNPDVTITTLPNPGGRMANYTLQKEILGCADFFLILFNTCSWVYSTQRWISTVQKTPDVPVVCWIERSGEEKAIQDYKKQTAQNMMKLYKTQNKLSAMKNDKHVSNRFESLYHYVIPYPVQDSESIVTSIKTAFGESTSIQEFDSTCLPHWGSTPTEPEKSLVALQELFKGLIEEASRVQKERGVNQTVQLNKKKNQMIRPSRSAMYFGGREVQMTEVKASRFSSFFSCFSKVFSVSKQVIVAKNNN